MTHGLTEARIRQIIREELVIAEATRLARDSVDDQIDSIVIGFEEASRVVEESLLREAKPEKDEEEPADDDQEDAPEEDTGSDDEDAAVGSEERNVDDPADPMRPKIDIDEFATKVARFIQNYDSMLDVKTVIIRRTSKFLDETYDDEDLTSKFIELLEREHDIVPTGTERQEIITPPAVGALGGGP